MPRTGFIDHIGIGVPDLGAAKQYYDELMAVLGLREWFEIGPGGPLNTGLTATAAHSCSSIKQTSRERTRVLRRAFTTSRSWLRPEPSFGKHTSGRVREGASSWTNHVSSPSMGSTVLPPTGSIPTGSSWRRFATLPKSSRRHEESRVAADLSIRPVRRSTSCSRCSSRSRGTCSSCPFAPCGRRSGHTPVRLPTG